MNIGIYIYDNAEVLDFSGPFEVFSTAKRLNNLPWKVFFVAEHAKPIEARGGMKVIPHYDFTHHPPIDVLMVVGGVHTLEQTKPAVALWISQVAPQARYVTSVCTGAFLLASAGVIAQQKVTTHWEDAEELARQFPKLMVDRQARWVQDGHVVTSAGISAGIDMALFLVSELAGRRLAQLTAKQMDYRWVD